MKSKLTTSFTNTLLEMALSESSACVKAVSISTAKTGEAMLVSFKLNPARDKIAAWFCLLV
jgi:hypothetical protein